MAEDNRTATTCSSFLPPSLDFITLSEDVAAVIVSVLLLTGQPHTLCTVLKHMKGIGSS